MIPLWLGIAFGASGLIIGLALGALAYGYWLSWHWARNL